jgi:hypothetical protein
VKPARHQEPSDDTDAAQYRGYREHLIEPSLDRRGQRPMKCSEIPGTELLLQCANLERSE